MRWSAVVRLVAVAAFGMWLAGCASESGGIGTPQVAQQREIVAAIRRYYESYAAEENNACSALIMSGVTRTEIVSENEQRLVVAVTYKYSNYAHRGSMRCRGIANRQFTLTRESGRFRVIGMTGERRRGASWRIW